MPTAITPPSLSASTSRGEATRVKIIQTARQLFLEQGYHATSMRQIADRAALAPGSIYNHFPGKEAIFAAALDAGHPYHVLLPALEQVDCQSVEAFVRQAAELLRRHQADLTENFAPLLFVEMVEFQGAHLQALMTQLLPRLLGLQQRLSAVEGSMRPIAVPVVLRTFVSLLAGYVLTDMILKGAWVPPSQDYDWQGGLIDIFLHGIVADRRPDA